MKSRTKSMPIRKSESSGTSLRKTEAAKAEKPRKFADVVKEIQKLRTKGKTVPEIASELKVSYVVANQVVLRSYKMTVRSEEVFDRQEKIRLGLL